MNIICINNKDTASNSLTKGKSYLSLDPDEIDMRIYGSLKNHYKIRNDLGVISFPNKSRFRTLSEIRNNKLDSIGI